MHPLHFLFLLNENSQRSALKVRFGLWLYQRLSGKKSSPVSEMDLARVHRALDAGQQWQILNYEDAQCEFPERLVAEWMTEAEDAGAVVRNHCEVIAVNVSQGRARGVLLARPHHWKRRARRCRMGYQLHRTLGRPHLPALHRAHG